MGAPLHPDAAKRVEIGKALGISAQRVYQIERDAFAKLRALVFGTDDFPAIREALSAPSARALLESDAIRADRIRDDNNRRRAETHRRERERRAPK